MEFKKLKSLFGIFLLISLSFSLQAQVNIGSGEAPASGALLQIKQYNGVANGGVNADKGLTLPRVVLSKKNQLYPMFLADPTQPTVLTPSANYSSNKAQLDKEHTGTIVYNITDDEIEELYVGLYQWDGEKWNSFQEKIGNAIAELGNCDSLKFTGIYENGVALSGHTMYIPLKVSKAGTYTIIATVKDAATNTNDNGYFFTTTGLFMSPGYYYITVQGSGTPLEFTPAGNPGDPVSITFNGHDILAGTGCSKNIFVKDMTVRPKYTMDCSKTNVFGEYYEEERLNTNGKIHYIELTLNVDPTSYGATYEITSNEVDGIKFSGSGILGNNPIVRIYGEGVPFDNRDKQFYITTNSESSTATCTALIYMIIPPKRLMTIGQGQGELLVNYNYNFGWVGNSPGYTNQMITDKDNFGPHPWSIVRYAGFDNQLGSAANRNEVPVGGTDHGGSIVSLRSSVSENMTKENFGRLLNGRAGYAKIDIVIIGYNTDMFASGTDYAAKADTLVEFMKKGGIVLMYCEQRNSNINFLRKVFNKPDITTTGGLGAGTRYRLGYEGNDEEMKMYYARNDDPILDGPFGNIAGSVWGEDASTTYYADKLPMEEVVLYSNMASANQVPSNKTAATLFRHATLPFIWSGDGGFNSSNGITTNESICPFKIGTRTINGHTYTHFPIYRQNFGGNNNFVQNAVFTANALAWCIKRADQLRKEQLQP